MEWMAGTRLQNTFRNLLDSGLGLDGYDPRRRQFDCQNSVANNPARRHYICYLDFDGVPHDEDVRLSTIRRILSVFCASDGKCLDGRLPTMIFAVVQMQHDPLSIGI